MVEQCFFGFKRTMAERPAGLDISKNDIQPGARTSAEYMTVHN
jgi:hypothetical protein